MELPLFERELTIQAKRIWPFGARMLPAALSAMFLFFAAAFEWAGTVPDPDDISKLLLSVTDFCLFSAILFVPPLLTAGLIAREKQERTLGLLLLADFGGRDIALAKLVSPFVLTATLLCSTLPVLSVASFFGGISVPDLAAMLGLYLVAGFAFCSFGLLCSTVANRPGDAFFLAIGGTMASLAAVYGVSAMPYPWAAEAYRFHPAFAAYMVDPSGGGPAVGYGSTVLSAVFSVACVWLTIRLLPKQAHRTESSGRPVKNRIARRRRGTGLGPIYSKLLRKGSGGLSTSSFLPLRFVAAGLLVCIGWLPCVGSAFIAYLLAYDVASSFDVARRRGIFDDLRLTAPNPVDFLRGLFLAHLWRGLFVFPALLAPVGALIFSANGIDEFFVRLNALSSQNTLQAIATTIFLAVAPLALLSAFTAQLLFIVAAASYHSRGTGNPSAQAFATVVVYLTLGMFLVFLIPLLLIVGSLGVAFEGDLAFLAIPSAFGLAGTVIFGFGAWLYYREYIARYLPYV